MAASPASSDGPRPVFLLSLPRSGSTLVQRVLAAHDGVATAPEPWILLPLLYTRRDGGVAAEYDHRTLVRTLDDLASRLPGGEAELRGELADTARRLYRAAGGPDARLFVDKTPRYHLIVHELIDLFPDAAYVFLWRNPLAVVASMVETWYGGRWYPTRHAVDLEGGLPRLVGARRRLGAQAYSARYEDLVSGGLGAWRDLTAAVGLDLDPTVLEHLDAHRLAGYAGDPSQEQHDRVSTASVDAWREVFRSPVRRRWARRWLDRLGPETLGATGYDAERILADLEALPARWGRAPRDLWDLGRERVRAAVRAQESGRATAHER